ncbi:hypothetical protein X759_21245 [Mesorhizobium sp. LSHC420B00]|nr:hypothetical protein X759_21245 [Mesorhizobium sp. LSHC420B00]
MCRRALLNDQHATEIPSHVIGGKAIVQRFAIRQPDLDKRRHMLLPSGELTFWRQFKR